MQGPGERRRARLELPRVEFDLNALALGTIGYLLLMVLWRGLAAALGGRGAAYADSTALQQGFLAGLSERLGDLPLLREALQAFGFGAGVSTARVAWRGARIDPELADWHYVAIGVLLLLVWSILSGALARTYALRMGRDESIGPDDALGFVLSNLRAFVLAPLFILGAAAFFAIVSAGCGALAAVPWAGGVLAIVAHPVSLLAALVVFVTVLGGIFGLPLLHAALATERNGMLDAVSRTYSYAFGRPVVFTVGLAIVAGVSGLIARLGNWFLDTVWLETFTAGARVNGAAADAIQAGFAAGRTLSLPDAAGTSGGAAVNVWVAWLMTALAVALLRGFVLSYAVGGLTDLYLLLRREVDGTDASQVYSADEPVSPLQAVPDAEPPAA